MNIFKTRAFRQGSFATAITILGVVLILVLYYVLSTISTRLDLRIDLTPERMFEITQESIDFLATLDKDVNIFVLNEEDNFVGAAQQFTFQANEVIRRYDSYSNRINLEYIDILRNPTFVARFSELDLRPNQIIVESPDTGRYRVIEFRDLFNIVTGQGGQTHVRSSRAEQVMTSAILNVTSDVQIRVSVLGGYNQSDITPFTDLLKMNNYEIIYENLATIEDIDAEATIAFLVAPARDISEDDLRKLDRFLSNDNALGRTLFYIAGAEQTPMSEMPNLAAWLAEWGIAVHDSVLFEFDMSHLFRLGDFFVGFVDYSDNEVAREHSQTVRGQDLFAASFYASPLSVLFEERGTRVVNPLLQTSEQSGIFPTDREITEDDLTGPHPVLILSTMSRFEGTTRLNSHVLVSGSYTSFSPTVLGEVNFANSAYFLELMNTLTDRDDTVRIQDKTFSITTIQFTITQFYVIAAVIVIILPVGMLISGIIVWLRRRHR